MDEALASMLYASYITPSFSPVPSPQACIEEQQAHTNLITFLPFPPLSLPSSLTLADSAGETQGLPRVEAKNHQDSTLCLSFSFTPIRPLLAIPSLAYRLKYLANGREETKGLPRVKV
jgi:hypothetical protein